MPNETTPATEYKQVGRNCLADFFGFDPHGAASMAEILASCAAFASASEDDGFGEGGPRARTCWSIGTYLPFVAMTIRKNGWLPKGKAYERDGHTGNASAVIAMNQLLDNEGKARNGEAPRSEVVPTDEDVATAEKTVAFFAEHFDNMSDEATSKLNDYEHNLRVAMMGGIVDARLAGIVASAINYAARETEKKSGPAADFKNSEYVGTLKKRQTFHNLTCIYPPFGNRPCVFADDFGNKITCYPKFEVVKGQTYDVVGTPTKQDEWKGIKSTYINRVALAVEKASKET